MKTMALIAGLIAAGLGIAHPAHAQTGSDPVNPTVTCTSRDGGYAECVMPIDAGVLLVQTLAGDCQEHRDWGYTQTGIWVDHGCSASFSPKAAPAEQVSDRYSPRFDRRNYDANGLYRGTYSYGAGYGSAYGTGKAATVVRCRSAGGGRSVCAIADRAGVRLMGVVGRSNCREGNTWGLQQGGIWVSDGCVADFEVITLRP